jgi:hypothetical protein
MASYPTSVKSFTSKNNGDVIQASHLNDLQDEVNALESGLLNGTAPLNSSNSTVASLAVTGTFNAKGAFQINGSAGSSGQVLMSQGGSSNPTWGTIAATTKPVVQWTAQGNQPPASAYATPDTRNSHPVLDFDGATDEEAVFGGALSTAYAGGGLTVETWWSLTSSTTGSFRVQAAIERMDTNTLDIDADSFAAFQSAGGTAPADAGKFQKVAVTFADGAQMDSLAAGEAFRLKIRRDADGTSGTDDITTDAELLRVVLRET